MMRNVLVSLVLSTGVLVASAADAQPRTAGAHAALVVRQEPSTAAGDGTMEEAPQPLTCGGRDICTIAAAHDAELVVVHRELAAIRARLTPPVPVRTARPVPPPVPRPGAVPVRTPIMRIRALETSEASTSLRLETLADDLPDLLTERVLCRAQAVNHGFILPPGTNCATVEDRLRALQSATARPSTTPHPTTP